MNACRDLGVSFSLDDFGTGYSSLTYFHRLPISILKIDRDFVIDMFKNSELIDIVEGVIRLADALNRPVVAEGVESIEHGLMLMQMGCQYIQGYGVSKPIPADELISWIDDFNQDEYWQHLHNSALNLNQDPVLNIAIYALQHCLLELRNMLESEQYPPDIAKYKFDCHFNNWYMGVGKARYGHIPRYAFLWPKYVAMQDLSKELLTIAEKEGGEQALKRFDEIEQIKNEFVVLLNKLSD